MSYPPNGDHAGSRNPQPARVRPRFYPTGAAPLGSDGEGRVLLDAESSDLSEQQFAASLEAPSAAPRRRFVPDLPGNRPQAGGHSSEQPATAAESLSSDEPGAVAAADIIIAETPVAEADDERFSAGGAQPASEMSMPADLCVGPDFSAASAPASEDAGNDDAMGAGAQWRQEVAARLHNYQSRRTRKPPRYPSLALKFDPPAYVASASAQAEPCATESPAPSCPEAATAAAPLAQEIEEAQRMAVDATNIIEFPRPLVPPPPRPDELAESILDLPRILDAPEAVPKQVPLGGIILQPEEPATASELELPLQVAPLTQRLLAAGVDGLLVAAATLMFALIADKVAPLLPSARVVLGLGVALPAVLWAVFQYAFLAYTGSTPGMRFAGLHLTDFDGSVPGRSTRRWRALAMALSAVSLGLGFLWCLLDEDTLCWHDRITRTYLGAGSAESSGTRPGPVLPQRVFACLRQVEAFLQRRERETSEEPPGPPQS